MNISTKGRYAIRALTDMAATSTDATNVGARTSLAEVAKRQGISLNYLEQIFSALRKAGLIHSIKGAGGGYVLNLMPTQISMRCILDAVEGDLELVDNTDPQSPEAQSTLEAVNGKLWRPLEQSLNRFLEKITLADIVKELEQQQNNASNMYYI